VSELPTPSNADAAAVARPTVLVVDDEDLVRAVVARRLRLAGFEVVEARDGLEALDVLPAGGVDIVLTDLHMPRSTGEQLARDLRRIPAMASAPILLMTGGPSDESRMRAAGCTGFVYKPLPDRLAEILRAALAHGSSPGTGTGTGAGSHRFPAA
jgi:two-component system chemotaxis response regulator CheY